ncbi:tumor necrosis factor receptor superfamily member 3-like [Rhinoraja longicauda]
MRRPGSVTGLWLLLMVTAACGKSLNHWQENDNTCKENKFYNSEAERCCSFCPPGKHRKQPCTSGSDTVCQSCPPNKYQDEWNDSFDCTLCVGTCRDPLLQVQKCTQTTRQICVCKPGMFCKTKTLNSCVQCIKHSSCDAGEFLAKAGTSTANNVCKFCRPGTFSDVKSLSTKCRPHTKCARLLKEGTATEDATCDKTVSSITNILRPSTNWSNTSTSAPVKPHPHSTTPRADHLTTLSIAVTTPKGNKPVVNLLLIVGLVLVFLLILVVSSLLFSRKDYFKSLLLSNRTKGSIYIMSPRTVYVGVETGDSVSPDQKDPAAKPLDSHIRFPQQESVKSQSPVETHTFPVEEEGKVFHDPVPAADC